MRLGIAVTTYNRAEMLDEHLRKLKAMTASEHIIVVCDDGSTDTTLATAASANADVVITGANKGIAWNKNRGLFYLHTFTDCDAYLLLDDDVCPQIQGWDLEWLIATLTLGHVNFCRDPSRVRFGLSTARDPGFADQVAGACIGFSREAVSRVGYFDTRFGRYGHEHSDISFRTVRAGLGGVIQRSKVGVTHYFYVIDGGISERPGPSNVDFDCLKNNEAVLATSQSEDLYRNPWRTDREREDFLEEVLNAFPRRHLRKHDNTIELDDYEYLEANPDVRQAGADPLRHYLEYGIREGRPLQAEVNS